jgi:glutathione peroxidase-family protein
MQSTTHLEFSKYLVDENGMLIGYFSKDVSPLNEKLLEPCNKSAG